MTKRSNYRSRGTATVEAVVVLPVFVILFVGMFFVRDMTGARLAADQEVRRCSWEYALNNNCGHKPAGCDHVVGDGHYGSLLPDNLDDTLNDLGNASKSKNTEGFKSVQRILEQFVTTYLAQAITKRFEAKKSVERERPGLFGGGKSVVAGKYSLACNVPAQEQKTVVEAVWNQFKP
jgi:hypothetical protein